jgi:hypothetical protein
MEEDMAEDDALVEGLKGLGRSPLDPALAARVRRRARAALAGRARPGRLHRVGRLGLPVLVTSAVAGYILWLVTFLAALGTS